MLVRQALKRTFINSLTIMASISDAATAQNYRIGTPGKPWGDAEKAEWRAQTVVQRTYQDEVVATLKKFKAEKGDLFDVEQYGALPYDEKRYPLFVVKSKGWQQQEQPQAAGDGNKKQKTAKKPCVLVTGGVHGYETSGVQGALLFLTSGAAEKYSEHFDFAVVPCVSPWGYEHIQRWNKECKDPNRSFGAAAKAKADAADAAAAASDPSSKAQGEEAKEKEVLAVGAGMGVPGEVTPESKALMKMLDGLEGSSAEGPLQWTCHVDLHETTNTDETEFMPARAAEAGKTHSTEEIPDGFYLAANSDLPQLAWQAAVIDEVRKVTHIAPADASGALIGETIAQEGLILLPTKALGLCCGVTNALYATTTEVYPDSPRASPEQCNRAQVAAITGGLDFLLKQAKATEGETCASDK